MPTPKSSNSHTKTTKKESEKPKTNGKPKDTEKNIKKVANAVAAEAGLKVETNPKAVAVTKQPSNVAADVEKSIASANAAHKPSLKTTADTSKTVQSAKGTIKTPNAVTTEKSNTEVKLNAKGTATTAKKQKPSVASPGAAATVKTTALSFIGPNKMMKKSILRGKSQRVKKISLRLCIDCVNITGDELMDVRHFENYLKSHWKVNNKINNLGTHVTFEHDNSKLYVNSDIHFSKSYLKYLTKRYLSKNSLRDWIRVVSTGEHSYELRYFKICDGLDNDEDSI